MENTKKSTNSFPFLRRGDGFSSRVRLIKYPRLTKAQTMAGGTGFDSTRTFGNQCKEFTGTVATENKNFDYRAGGVISADSGKGKSTTPPDVGASFVDKGYRNPFSVLNYNMDDFRLQGVEPIGISEPRNFSIHPSNKENVNETSPLNRYGINNGNEHLMENVDKRSFPVFSLPPPPSLFKADFNHLAEERHLGKQAAGPFYQRLENEPANSPFRSARFDRSLDTDENNFPAGNDDKLRGEIRTMIETLERAARELEQRRTEHEQRELAFEKRCQEFVQQHQETAASLESVEVKDEKIKLLESEQCLLKQELAKQKRQAAARTDSLQKQVADLQNDICDKEARCSRMRSENFVLKEELRQAKNEAETVKTRLKIAEESNARSHTELARWRIRFLKQRPAPPAAAADRSAVTKDGISPRDPKTLPAKSVRFLLPDEEDDERRHQEMFSLHRRTTNKATQAETPLDISTQTSFVNSQPVAAVPRLAQFDFQAPSTSAACASISPIFDFALREGKKEIVYSNGTIQRIENNSQAAVTYVYTNDDYRRVFPDGREVYLFASDAKVESKETDGTVFIRYSDGRLEKRFADGKITVESLDGVKRTRTTDGNELIEEPNGASLERRADGVEIARFPDGGKEIRCREFMRREFPDGTVKTQRSDGTVETKLPSGHVRIKDAAGNLIQEDYQSKAAAKNPQK